jgi:hypothetical protein
MTVKFKVIEALPRVIVFKRNVKIGLLNCGFASTIETLKPATVF